MADALPAIVYLLCFATSGACAWLLARNYRRTRAPLLLWSSLCFLFLAANNALVILDLLLVRDIDFRLARLLTSLAAVSLLIFGFIWNVGEEEE